MGIHSFVGNLGHTLVIVSFVTALLTAAAYYLSVAKKGFQRQEWISNGRQMFYLHGAAVAGVVGCLYWILFSRYFEYHYAWNHSANELPFYYIISSFWEGQEGSFILWIFWNVLIGLAILRFDKKFEPSVMAVVALVQVFLSSMVLGVMIGDFKLGSSPFILLRDALSAPVFETNPDFIPENGTGLNPLLQNIWMVIHPPILFMGYALSLVPFAYALAGMWTKQYKEWVRPAFPWAIFGVAVLGLGIILGGYWAYVTLSFGGFWAWDPVENAVYVPWLIMVGAVHTMLIFRKNSTALRTSIALSLAGFLLILYSTFLTRSGILGNASVHSFTDLGLSGQLLIGMLFFLALSAGMCVLHWKKMPSAEQEVSVYTKEFWIFLGVTVLCLMAFQVIVPTSIPVWNSIAGFFGIESNIAMPAEPVPFYNKFQLWFAVGLALLSGTGQFFFWRKMKRDELFRAMAVPVMVSMIISALVIVLAKVHTLPYILFLTASVYTIVANVQIFVRFLGSASFRLSGGSVSHIGLGLMLLGILFSSGYSKIISLNNTGRIIFERAEDEAVNIEHQVLWVNQPVPMGDYQANYLGKRIKVEGVPYYVELDRVEPADQPMRVVAANDFVVDGVTYFLEGDTLKSDYSQVFCEIEYFNEQGERFRLFPRVQDTENQGMLRSPSLKRDWNQDLFAYIAYVNIEKDEPVWENAETFEVKQGERFFINDFVAEFTEVKSLPAVGDLKMEQGDAAIKARIKVHDKNRVYWLEPMFIIKDQRIGRVQGQVPDLGIHAVVEDIDPETGTFTFSVAAGQKDFVVVRAEIKPMINFMWIGTVVLMLGLCMAAKRRFDEFRKMQAKKNL